MQFQESRYATVLQPSQVNTVICCQFGKRAWVLRSSQIAVAKATTWPQLAIYSIISGLALGSAGVGPVCGSSQLPAFASCSPGRSVGVSNGADAVFQRRRGAAPILSGCRAWQGFTNALPFVQTWGGSWSSMIWICCSRRRDGMPRSAICTRSGT